MLELKVDFEFEDREIAKNISLFVREAQENTPPEVTSVRKVTAAGELEAADWHFLELLIAFGAGVGAGAAKKVGETVVEGVMWLAKAVRKRLATRSEAQGTLEPEATVDGENRPIAPTVRMEVHRKTESISITITGATTEQELRQFAEAAGRLAGA